MIQRILDEEGVPQEMIHLAQAESGFMPRAISRKAAGGMWQFVIFRGREYGLTQTTLHRRAPGSGEGHPRGGPAPARPLHEFGDWYLAIAAYNCGPGVDRRLSNAPATPISGSCGVAACCPAETTNYVPIILAMTIMEKNAAEYGLAGIQLDPPLEYDTVETTAPTSLSLVADVTDTSVAELATLNPAVLKGMVPENFALRVPKGSGSHLMATLQMIPAQHRDFVALAPRGRRRDPCRDREALRRWPPPTSSR